MVNYVGEIENGVNIYSDSYMVDDNLLRGRKGDENEIYLVASPKTANFIYETYKIGLRKKKLERICNG